MNRNDNLNKLRALAESGNAAAMAVLMAGQDVPAYRRKGFGVRDYNKGRPTVSGTYVTSKTHKTVPCLQTKDVNIAYHVDRLNMLKLRQAKREMRATAHG